MWVSPNIDFTEFIPLGSDDPSENFGTVINNDFEIDGILFLQTTL